MFRALTADFLNLFLDGFLNDRMSVTDRNDCSASRTINETFTVFKVDVDAVGSNSNRWPPWCSVENVSRSVSDESFGIGGSHDE